jgi:hypothetical protein
MAPLPIGNNDKLFPRRSIPWNLRHADVQLTPDGVQDQIVERATDLAPYRPGPPSPCFA